MPAMTMHQDCLNKGNLVVCQHQANLTAPIVGNGDLLWEGPAYNISDRDPPPFVGHTPTPSGDSAADYAWYLLNMYYPPSLIAVGVTSNVVLSAVLIGSHLQHNSANHYLSAALLTDAIYLVGLLLHWLRFVDLDVYNRKGWCHLISFISRVSSFLSLWLVVAFAVDRLLVHVAPRRSATLCTPFRAKLVILAMTIVAVVVFVNISLTVGVVMQPDGTARCMPLMRFVSQLRHLDLVDGVVNIIVPYAVIFTALFALVRCAYVHRKDVDDARSVGVVELDLRGSNFQTRPLRLTAFSIALLLAFLCMRLPSDILRLVHSVCSALNKFSHTARPGMLRLQHITAFIFHAAFAVKPLLAAALHGPLRALAVDTAASVRRRMCPKSPSGEAGSDLTTVMEEQTITSEKEAVEV